MKKEIKGFICGILICGILGGVGVGAAGMWKNIPVLENDIEVVVNGKILNSDNFVYNDTTYLPLRAVSETVGLKVTYDGTNNTAYIGNVPNQYLHDNAHYYDEVEWALILHITIKD